MWEILKYLSFSTTPLHRRSRHSRQAFFFIFNHWRAQERSWKKRIDVSGKVVKVWEPWLGEVTVLRLVAVCDFRPEERPTFKQLVEELAKFQHMWMNNNILTDDVIVTSPIHCSSGPINFNSANDVTDDVIVPKQWANQLVILTFRFTRGVDLSTFGGTCSDKFSPHPSIFSFLFLPF